MQSVLGELIDSIVSMPGEFTTIALHDPLAALMLLVGSVLMLVSMGVFGYLSLGGIAAAIIPEPSGQGRPREER